MTPLRALPRFFFPGLSASPGEAFGIPTDELKKIRHVLRLGEGDEIAVLPDDGTLLRCVIEKVSARVTSVAELKGLPERKVVLALGLPRQDKLEESVRMATELGVAGFIVFPAQRSVVRWEPAKFKSKLERLRTIAREASEVAFRPRLPFIETSVSLDEVLSRPGNTYVMSEGESVGRTLGALPDEVTLVIGPEGGWSPTEVHLIGGRAVTLGPLVFRVDTAATASAALAIAAPKV